MTSRTDRKATASPGTHSGRWLALAALLGGCASPGDDLGTGEFCRPVAGETYAHQGELVFTGVATDLAIEGHGYLAVGTATSGQAMAFTRDGQLTVDDRGRLVTLDGEPIQGWVVGGDGPGPFGDLVLDEAALPPRATSVIRLAGVLQATTPLTGAFDPDRPFDTSSLVGSVEVHDALGRAHMVALYFTRTGAGRWSLHALVEGGELEGGAAGTATVVASASLVFDGAGRLQLADHRSSFLPRGTTAAQPLAFDFSGCTLEAPCGMALDGLREVVGASAFTLVDQDGAPEQRPATLGVLPSGEVRFPYDAGAVRTVAVIGIATFPRERLLTVRDDGRLLASWASGPPSLGAPCWDGRPCLASGCVEARQPLTPVAYCP